MFRNFRPRILVVGLALMLPLAAAAQHPIEIQRKASDGEYFAALKLFEKMPKRRTTTAARLAAAKAAWGLSLPDRAIAEFELALRDETLTDLDRAKIYISRGIIELQEGRPRVAIPYAEKAGQLIADAGPLRSKSWLLWAESLALLGSFGGAEDKYINALDEAEFAERPDIHYRLGLCELKLDKLDGAKDQFEQVPLAHERAPQAVRYLASIALDQKRYEDAGFWLTRGQQEYGERFLDSWVDYAMLQVAIQEKNQDRVREIRAAAVAKYPPSDPWLTMLNAAGEAFEWSQGKGE